VYDVPGREFVPPGNSRLTVTAAAEQPALFEQARSSGAMNGAVHATSAEQRRVRGVYDRVDVLPGYISLPDVKALE